jgi:hypothetical protein
LPPATSRFTFVSLGKPPSEAVRNLNGGSHAQAAPHHPHRELLHRCRTRWMREEERRHGRQYERVLDYHFQNRHYGYGSGARSCSGSH